jgi:hypothetical protein
LPRRPPVIEASGADASPPPPPLIEAASPVALFSLSPQLFLFGLFAGQRDRA